MPKINLDPWKAEMESRPVGWHIKVLHCGSSLSLSINKGEEYVWGHCFRCHEKGRYKHKVLDVQSRIARLASKDESDAISKAGNPALPLPKNQDVSSWPMEMRLYLYKMGLSNQDIVNMGLYWHEGMDRLVLPVPSNHNNGLQDGGWQAKSFHPDRPKYIQAMEPGLTAPFWYSLNCGNCVALTEDILSALKVNKHMDVYALMGTSLPDALAIHLAKQHREVLILLDNDPPGIKAAKKIEQKLDSMGVATFCRFFASDPKYASYEEIRKCRDEVVHGG